MVNTIQEIGFRCCRWRVMEMKRPSWCLLYSTNIPYLLRRTGKNWNSLRCANKLTCSVEHSWPFCVVETIKSEVFNTVRTLRVLRRSVRITAMIVKQYLYWKALRFRRSKSTCLRIWFCLCAWAVVCLRSQRQVRSLGLPPDCVLKKYVVQFTVLNNCPPIHFIYARFQFDYIEMQESWLSKRAQVWRHEN